MKKVLKIVGIIAGVFIALLIGLAMLAPTDEVVEVKTDGSNKKAEEPKHEDKVYKVGDVIKINGVELSIVSAKFTNPQQYVEPEKGKVLTLEVEAVNKSDTQAFIDNTEFNLYDKEGNNLEQYYGYDDTAISGDINRGKKITGKLYFDVPALEAYELIYTPTFSTDNTEIKFNIVPSKQ
jgi:hypothetical protein